jgi:hypothetical protein
MPIIPRRIIYLILSIIIFLALFWLRMIPSVGNAVEFTFDSASYYRLTQQTIQSGRVPAIDSLSTYPQGREIKSLLPTLLFSASASFYKLINIFKPVTLNHAILLFCALFGASICIPLYFLSFAIYRNKIIACLTAFLAGIIPAYLQRSCCYWFRFEVMATPIIFMSLLFFIKALDTRESRKTFLYTIFFAFFSILSLYTWRLSSFFLIACVIVILYLWITDYELCRKKWIITVVVLAIFISLPWFIPGLRVKSPLFSTLSLPKAIFQVTLQRLGIKQNLSEYARIFYSTQEFAAANLIEFFNNKFLSLSGLLAIFYFTSYFRVKETKIVKDVLFIFLSLFLILTAIILRMKIILGPLVALTLGESLVFISNKRNKRLRNLVICLIAVMFMKTGFDACKLMATRYKNTQIEPDLKQAIGAINKLLPKHAVILCDWPEGYFIQTYCMRPTLTDGLLESPQIIQRAIAIAKIYYSTDENALLEFCRRFGVTHILISVEQEQTYAVYAGIDYDNYRIGKRDASFKSTLFYRLIRDADSLKSFSRLYSNATFILYEIKPAK